MNPPPLLKYEKEEAFKNHYIENYCNKSPITTFDGINVYFYPEKFEHSFYRRKEAKWKAEKNEFDVKRGERMDWIKYVLQDSTIKPKQGYDHARRRYDKKRRVAFLSQENYLVVISLDKEGKGKFVTAYLIDNDEAAMKIRTSPDWEK